MEQRENESKCAVSRESLMDGQENNNNNNNKEAQRFPLQAQHSREGETNEGNHRIIFLWQTIARFLDRTNAFYHFIWLLCWFTDQIYFLWQKSTAITTTATTASTIGLTVNVAMLLAAATKERATKTKKINEKAKVQKNTVKANLIQQLYVWQSRGSVRLSLLLPGNLNTPISMLRQQCFGKLQNGKKKFPKQQQQQQRQANELGMQMQIVLLQMKILARGF